jgi:Tol biopolymer transport system component
MRLTTLAGAALLSPSFLAAQVPAHRAIDFTTREGTWMSPDVSRDGATIVVDIVGDLYTMPRAGGIATPIITGPDFASQPRYSPDGRQLLYISDRSGSDNLWVAASNGTNARQLTHLPRSVLISPAWSADGSTALVTVITGFFPFIAAIWEFDTKTGEGAALIENSNGPTARDRTAPRHPPTADSFTSRRSRRAPTARATAQAVA